MIGIMHGLGGIVNGMGLESCAGGTRLERRGVGYWAPRHASRGSGDIGESQLGPSNVAFSCWRGLASSVKARQRLCRRKMQGRASQLQRDVRPAVALNSRCYERLRTPRCGLVMVVVLVGACPWLRPGTVKRPSLSLALSDTEDCGTPRLQTDIRRAVARGPNTAWPGRCWRWEAGPVSGLNSDLAGITATRPEGGR